MLRPVEDLKKIKELFADVDDFDPKKYSITDFIDGISSKVKELNVILKNYFG